MPRVASDLAQAGYGEEFRVPQPALGTTVVLGVIVVGLAVRQLPAAGRNPWGLSCLLTLGMVKLAIGWGLRRQADALAWHTMLGRYAEESDGALAEGDSTPRRRMAGRSGARTSIDRIDEDRWSAPDPSAFPACGEGTVYDKVPGVLVRITGQPPLAATVYQLQKLRCHLCGQVFTADAPAAAGPRKYDATAGSMIGLLKYGSGLPFNRLDGLQGGLGVPLPASTQWDIVEAVAGSLAPALDELIRQSAQGEVLHNDDTWK